jgi:asparagine synthase (glutamine-hydrolysing)
VANFVALLDPDSQRRSDFERATLPVIAPVDGLEVGSLSSGQLFAAWAASPRVPVSSRVDVRGAAVIWGEAHAGGRGPVAADELPPSDQFDGFHAALHYDASVDELTASADPIGLFPVYFWCEGETALVASSPELFRRYEGFRTKVSLEGLAGILLTGGLVGGRALLEGVRRLGPGSRLRLSPHAAPAEERLYRPVTGARQPWRRQVEEIERLDAVLASAVRRQAPAPGPYGLTLSGGRDSRMLGGYLHRQGARVHALSLGVPGEYDAHLARRAARVIGASHRVADVSSSEFLHYARQEARWAQVGNGFNGVAGWGQPALLLDLPPRVVTGYGCDDIVGGTTMKYCFPEDGGPPSFEAFFRRATMWGVGPAPLKELLGREGDQVVEHITGDMRTTYEKMAELAAHRSWRFVMEHRQRFNSGSMPWRLSFGAWPVLPASTDRAVIDAAADTSVGLLADRVLQHALIAERFPRLAAIPVNGIGTFPSPILPTGPEYARRLAWRATFGVRRRAARRPIWWGERWARIYDFNGEAWLSVRRHAERHRERAHEMLDREALARLLPPPSARPSYSNMIAGPSGSKTLLGLLIWLGEA